MTVNLVVKVPEELRRRARAVAALRGETIADIVRARLEEYIRESQAETQAEDDRDWARLGIEQFFAGYAESDAVYDAL